MDKDSKSILDEIRKLLKRNKKILNSVEPERKKLQREQEKISSLLRAEINKSPTSSVKIKRLNDKYLSISKKLNNPNYTIIYNEVNNRYQKIYELKKKYENQVAYEKGFLFGAMDKELESLKQKTENLIIKKKNKNKIPTNDSLWAIADDMRIRKEDGQFDTYREAYEWASENYVKKNVKIDLKNLERAYHKAKSEGRVGEK